MESTRRSKILSRILRHGDRVFKKNSSGRYCACDIWKAYHREFQSPQLLIAMTIPLGNDKQRFHWSVSDGTGDWRDFPGTCSELAHSRVAVLEATHGHSISYVPSVTSVTVLTQDLCSSIGCIVHGTTASNEASIKANGLVRAARGAQNARTSVHFAAYRHAGGIQSYHDYGLNVYLRTADLIGDGFQVTMNINGVVLCDFDIPLRYLVVSDIHPRSVLKDQTYPGEIVQRRWRQSSDAAASTDVPSTYQAPPSTAERREEQPIADQSSASAARDDSQPSQTEDDGSGDIIVARWLKQYGFKSSIVKELHATLLSSPEAAFEEEVLFEGEDDVEVKLSADDVRRVLADAEELVQFEREEESKKRQKEREREEREETRAKKAKEVHEWMNTAPSKSSNIDIKLIQASLQEAEEARGPTSIYHFEADHDSLGEPVPVYRPLASLPFRISTRLKEMGYNTEDTWCYNLQSGFARTFEYATHYCGRAQFLMDLIDGMDKTCDAQKFHDLIHRYRSNLKEFFPRFNEWQRWIKTHVEDACHAPTFTVQWLGLYVREIWIQLDAEDLVASEHYRPGISTTQPDVSASVNGGRTPGLHLLFDSVDEVTAETVMVAPLYLLGLYKAWAEQMPWNDLPSRVMDVYKHLHARCQSTTLHPSIPTFSFARHTSVVGVLRRLKTLLAESDPTTRTSVENEEIFEEMRDSPAERQDIQYVTAKQKLVKQEDMEPYRP
eukprot:1256225-Amphidinium_carterae.3